MQARRHAKKGSSLALKPRADVTRSPKQGYQWPHKKELCPQKFFFLGKIVRIRQSCHVRGINKDRCKSSNLAIYVQLGSNSNINKPQ